MTTHEVIGCFRVFEMKDDGEMVARTRPRMTAAECFEWISDVEEAATAEFEPTSTLGVYRRVEGGWEEVIG